VGGHRMVVEGGGMAAWRHGAAWLHPRSTATRHCLRHDEQVMNHNPWWYKIAIIKSGFI